MSYSPSYFGGSGVSVPKAANDTVTLEEVVRGLPNLYGPVTEGNNSANPPVGWRIGVKPFALTMALHEDFLRLGPVLWQVQWAWQQLYLDSFHGKRGIPPWVARWLNQGKPESVIQLATQKRFKNSVPLVLRPDILLTDPCADDGGWALTELDSVPGGLGFTAALQHAYQHAGFAVLESTQGFIDDFWQLLEGAHQQQRKQSDPLRVVAIVVSEESNDYRRELTWLAEQLQQTGHACWVVHPKQLSLHGEALCATLDNGEQMTIDLVYRFFELFDLPNIPNWPLVQFAAQKGWVALTPPPKPYLEEKLWWALWHHPVLKPHWEGLLGKETVEWLTPHIPQSWVMDPAPLPPSAIIPNLRVGGHAVQSWDALAAATQKERQLVLKPSGFSPLAWGSRGVVMGHDVPSTEWAEALTRAQNDFSHTPWVLQQFHKPAKHTVMEYDPMSPLLRPLEARTRLCPYYFASPDSDTPSQATLTLAGILATHCPADKKIIHGMRDGLMVPCALP
ncbi:MAG: hypothetical protein QE263_00955 [Vampirovibrionales bacterium]|nr:hypothetical protein [Vampirovibrionales bacterium]